MPAKVFDCSICQRAVLGYPCNAWPVNDGHCCEHCDNTVVTPARIVLASRQILERKEK